MLHYSCSVCGNTSANFTSSQLRKNEKARCVACVDSGKRGSSSSSSSVSSSEQLLEQAVCDIDLSRCNALLNAGADPNYHHHHHHSPANLVQLCFFRVSDCCLNDAQRADLNCILQTLLRFGAKITQDDAAFFLARYGVPQDDDAFHAAMYQTIVVEHLAPIN